MKKIKTIGLILGFISFVTAVNAQSSITIEASPLYTSFKFDDSRGTALNNEYSGILTGGYGLGYRFDANNGLMIRAGLGMRHAGATLIYDDMNYRWDMQYADVKLGGGYMLKTGSINPYLNVSGYYSYMISGFQTINNEEFDIKNSKSLNEMDYGVYFTPGVQFIFSSAVSSFVEFNYMMGLQNLEMDEGQKSTNVAYGLTLGLSFSFGKLSNKKN
ncbi:MAG: outer membrane beta-barrel protein [Salinivirgaceae bacterium]|jgi:hypothetical protein